jgi:hypothetical protein
MSVKTALEAVKRKGERQRWDTLVEETLVREFNERETDAHQERLLPKAFKKQHEAPAFQPVPTTSAEGGVP